MPTYADYVELARICWRQARAAQTDGAAAVLRKMAHEYQQNAARLNGGKLPEIGDPDTDGKALA